MLSAKKVKSMLRVTDFETVAYGYTLDRETVHIYFLGDELVRATTQKGGDKITYQNSKNFEPSYFHGDIKRFYAERTNDKLIELFSSFGNPLALTSLGHT